MSVYNQCRQLFLVVGISASIQGSGAGKRINRGIQSREHVGCERKSCKLANTHHRECPAPPRLRHLLSGRSFHAYEGCTVSAHRHPTLVRRTTGKPQANSPRRMSCHFHIPPIAREESPEECMRYAGIPSPVSLSTPNHHPGL